MSGSETHSLPSQLPASGGEITPVNRRMLERCRDMVIGTLAGTLTAVMDKVLDELFKEAEKARYPNVQRLYLDAMTIARDKRAVIEAGFRKHVQHNFERSLKGLPLKSAPKAEDPESLSLVEPDDLEESLALQDMASKIREFCAAEIPGIEQRMAVLVEDEKFARRRNPLSPEVLADAFMSACKDTHAEIKVVLIFVMMWDKHMRNGVLTAYREVNGYLIEKGILPKLTLKRPRHQGRAPQTAGAPAAVDQVDGDTVAALQQFLRALMVSAPAGVAGGGDGVAPVYVPNPALVSQLTELQHGGAVSLAATPGAPPVGVLRDIRAGVLAGVASQVEHMTIEIVAMLFDYIFDDKAVPDPIKAQLGRLQIPVLKAALLDQAFFTKKQHPARRLLNAMAEASVGWAEPMDHQSPLYRRVASIVQRVLDTFEDDVQVFSDALAEFETFLAETERAAEQLARAGAELLVKREREQQLREEARLVAEDTVRDRAARDDLPEALREFLAQRWTQVLARAFLLGGTEGPEWSVAVAVMDDLIWSVEPKSTDSERKSLVARLPSMLKRLREGLDSAGVPPAVCEQFMSQLVVLHAAAVKAGFQAPQEEPDMTPVPARARPGAVVLPFPKQVATGAAQDLTLEILRRPDGGAALQVEEITIAPMRWLEDVDDDERHVAAEEKPEHLAPSGHTVAELRPGMWVEFRHHGGEVLVAKLKWISPMKTAYLFTDREGKQAATMPQDKLEAAFRIGSARILDEAPLVDRAVDNVLETLKRNAA